MIRVVAENRRVAWSPSSACTACPFTAGQMWQLLQGTIRRGGCCGGNVGGAVAAGTCTCTFAESNLAACWCLGCCGWGCSLMIRLHVQASVQHTSNAAPSTVRRHLTIVWMDVYLNADYCRNALVLARRTCFSMVRLFVHNI